MNDSQKKDVTVPEQIPLQRQYGNKKKFVINSFEKEGTKISENQQTGKSVYYLINRLITLFFSFFLFLILYINTYLRSPNS